MRRSARSLLRIIGQVVEGEVMNGAHDLGGMHGFGRVHPEDSAPFHAAWEKRVRGMMMLLLRRGVFNLDEMRRAIESIPPAQYLASSYFERWLAAIGILLKEKGHLNKTEIETLSGHFAPARQAWLGREDVAAGTGPVTEDPMRSAPRFRPGDRVVAKNRHVKGHTRLPRYVRGRQGVVDRVHGIYTFPDTNAHGLGEYPQPVYSVRFAARNLWGNAAAPRDSVCIDLWESYLDPA